MEDPANGCLAQIEKIREGYSEGLYNRKKYSITKQVFNQHRSFKVYAKELGGNDFISLNYYITQQKEQLKPCEMSARKVIHFLNHVQFI